MHVASPAGASRGGGGGVGRIQRGCLTTSSHTHASTPVEAEQAERRPRKHEKHHAGRDAIKWNKINAPTHSAVASAHSAKVAWCLAARVSS